MSKLAPELVTGIIAGGIVLAALVVYATWLSPANRSLEEAVGRAQSQAARIRSEAPERASEAYRAALMRLRQRAVEASTTLDSELEAQRAALFEWLPGVRLKPAANVPYVDSFRERFAFEQDDLRRKLLAASGSFGFDSGRVVPLQKAAFDREGRDPKSEAEMREVQLRHNIEELVLPAAAKVGALPYEATEFRALTDGERGRFVTQRVTLKLEVDGPRVPSVLRALAHPSKSGPLIVIDGLSTRPAPLPKTLEANAPGRVFLEVVLGVQVPRPLESRS